MIDRITDAGQCDYYDVIIKVIYFEKQLNKDYQIIVWNRCATDLPLIQGKKTNRVCKQHRTTDFRTNLFALVCDLSNINMEKKIISLRICISSFVHCYGKQKSLRIVEKKKKKKKKKPEKTVQRWAVYGNVRLTKVPNEATLQAVRWNISSVQADCLDE